MYINYFTVSTGQESGWVIFSGSHEAGIRVSPELHYFSELRVLCPAEAVVRIQLQLWD
jgi:hypothetical protein